MHPCSPQGPQPPLPRTSSSPQPPLPLRDSHPEPQTRTPPGPGPGKVASGPWGPPSWCCRVPHLAVLLQGAGLHTLHCLGLLLPVVLAPLLHLARPLVHDPLLPVPSPGHGKQVGPFPGLDFWNPMPAGGLPKVCVCVCVCVLRGVRCPPAHQVVTGC